MLTDRSLWSARHSRRLCTTTLGHGSMWLRPLAHGSLCWLDFQAKAGTVPRNSAFVSFTTVLGPFGRGTPIQHAPNRPGELLGAELHTSKQVFKPPQFWR